MAAGEIRIVEGRRGGDLLRRGVLAALGLYLAPAVLVVLLIGSLGLACCAALGLVLGKPVGAVEGHSRRHGPSPAVGAPHVRVASRSQAARR